MSTKPQSTRLSAQNLDYLLLQKSLTGKSVSTLINEIVTAYRSEKQSGIAPELTETEVVKELQKLRIEVLELQKAQNETRSSVGQLEHFVRLIGARSMHDWIETVKQKDIWPVEDLTSLHQASHQVFERCVEFFRAAQKN